MMSKHGEKEDDDVSVSKEADKQPVVVFSHGAAVPSTSDWMIRWKGMLAKELQAVEVITFDYPYIADGKKGPPPKAEKLVPFHADIVKKALIKYPGHPLVLVGKSMGSRISCMVAGEEGVDATAIVCLGYPLMGANGEKILLQLTVPTLFLQGSEDGLCPLKKLEVVQKKMQCFNNLHVIEGGDHSFKIAEAHLLSSGTTQEEAENIAIQAIAAFVSKSISGI